jgi:hypothetical protein
MSEGLFPDDEFKNEKAEAPWTKGETDQMLELYFAGCPPGRIAVALKRNPKAIRRRLEQFTYNERDRAVLYTPTNRRSSRKGKRITENEKLIIREHWEREVPIEATAKVLQRDPNEIRRDHNSESQHQADSEATPGANVDLILAYRYCYYVKGVSIVTDQAYDLLEKEAIEFGGGYAELTKPGSDKADDYPPHIRALGMYLIFKYAKRTE